MKGEHYCFGPADIYVHDGTTKPPLLECTGLDLDETGSAATNFTVVTRLYPKADTIN